MSESPESPAAAPRAVPVFVNARRVEVAADATVLDAVRALDPASAEELVAGTRAVTDSRGLPAQPTDGVYAGAIFRLVSARAARAAADEA